MLRILLSIFPYSIIASSLYQINTLSFPSNNIWSYKNGGLSVTLISTLILGHVPISSLRLNSSLYLYSKSITSFFSFLLRHELSKSMYVSEISLSVMCLHSSSGSNHGHLSSNDFCSLSIFSVFTNLL